MGRVIIPEIEISKKFNHKNVIYVYSILEDDINYYIIMEYCSKGELFDYIVSKKKLSKEESSIFFYQLINGMEYIHSKGYVHRDLKPENLLLTNKNILKIIDFGLAHAYNDDMLLKTKCGSPSYAAPEVLKGNKYDGFKSDIWCCGITLHAMLCGFLPFEGENNKILFKNIIKCELKLEQFDDEIIKNLIKSLLNPNPKLRISISEIKKNEFYLKGQILFQKMENNYNLNKKYLKIKKNNIVVENQNSKRSNANIIYKIFDKLSTDRIKKLNFNLLNYKNDNSLKNESKKIINDKISLDLKILRTSKNAEEIISRHTNKIKKFKLTPNLKIFHRGKFINNNFMINLNLNKKIKKLLKKNNSEEDKNESLKYRILPNFRKITEDIIVKTNEDDSEIKRKKERNRFTEENNNKKENYASISILTKIEDNDERSKSLKNKDILKTYNNRFNKKLIFNEPSNFRNQENKIKIKNDKKSYNLYRITDNDNKLKKSDGFRIKRYLFTENTKGYRKNIIDLYNKEIINELPLLKNNN